MTSYPVNKSPEWLLRGTREAKEKFAQRMAKEYQLTIAEALAITTVTHVGPSICPCYGCRKRREWHRK